MANAQPDDVEEGDLTSTEQETVTPNEKAGLVTHLACHFCGLKFDVKKTRSLRAHIEEAHVLGGSGYMCGICCEEFTTKKAVENHMSTFHRTPKPLGCGTCGETFRVRNLLLKHIDSHTSEELENNKVGLCYCGECFEFFDNVMSLQAHSQTHKEINIFVCAACGLQSQHRHIMIKHLETHVISELLKADDSVEEVPEIPKLDPIHIDASRIQVDASSVESVAKEETVMEVDQPDTSYKCGVCNASFTNLADALGHTETHQEEDTTKLVETLVEEQVLVEGEELAALLPDTAIIVTETTETLPETLPQ